MKDFFCVCEIFLIRRRLNTEEFRAFDKAIQTDGEILFIKGDKASVVDGKELRSEILVIDFIIGKEIFMDFFNLGLYCLRNVNSCLLAFCTRRLRLMVITFLEPVETPPAPNV